MPSRRARLRARLSQRWARRSIATRLLLAALLLVGLALPLAGAWLAHYYKRAAVDAFDERLEATLNVVIAGVTFDAVANTLDYPSALGDARFDQVFSGWYWQITDQSEHRLASRSLWDQRLPVTDSRRASARSLKGPRGQPLRVVERDIYLAPLETPLHVSVAADESALQAEILGFQRLLWLGTLALSVLLLGVLALQVRFGLAPLRRMNANLREVEKGAASRMNTRLPEELATLATSMNAVLARDQRLIERGRHTAGNLAHALKTPLSVMRLQLSQLPEAQRERFDVELSRIDSAVRHHLARASAAGDGLHLAPIALEEALAGLIEGLGRLAGRRQVALETRWQVRPHVRMDRQDVQEVVGNLLDNALRWAESRVTLCVQSQGETLHLSVADDGPGMDEAQCQAALERGKRLDEQRSNSGLGLSIVADLVALYQGTLTLTRAQAGGLHVAVTLPVVARG
ncbi:sensor histidine kinase [Halomonas sp. HMF6819]|uniref:sensor histidine kinase n=1 Tax=Halomonas sp. HMF6819 TaxID=3373085 RepID=UPI0037ABFC6D